MGGAQRLSGLTKERGKIFILYGNMADAKGHVSELVKQNGLLKMFSGLPLVSRPIRSLAFPTAFEKHQAQPMDEFVMRC